MIGWLMALWGKASSKVLEISIYIGAVAIVLWWAFLSGVNKQKVSQYEKDRKDAEKRNQISAEADATDPAAVRRKLHDRWSAS